MRRLFLYSFLLCIVSINAQLHLAGIFADNAVFQQEKPIPVWGNAIPGAGVNITFGEQKIQALANDNGDWKVLLQPMKADGKPYRLTVTSKDETLEIRNILLGEVWFASGQSNMEWRIKNGVVNLEQETADAIFPDIRICTVDVQTSAQPLKDIRRQEWKSCTPEAVKEFSAIAYFFARALHTDRKVPVGIIVAARGATNLETWMSRERLLTHPDFTEKLLKTDTDTARWNQKVRDAIQAEKDRETIANTSTTGLNLKVHTPAFDDSKWNKSSFPLNMTKMGYPGFWGLVWIRKTFEIPAGQHSAKWKLILPIKDQNDRIYLNGKEIAQGVSKLKDKTLTLSSGTLKKGKNLLAVRMYVHWGSAEIGNDVSPCYLLAENGNRVELNGEWTHSNKTEPAVAQWQNYYNSDNVNYNAMVNPVIPYAIRGFLWYQGENNASRFKQYAELQPLLIDDWRVRWGQGYLPFLFVQLANYKERLATPVDNDDWASFRDAQASTLLRSPNTAMACAIDIGDGNDIHPKNKQEAAARLYLAAKYKAYGDEIVFSGPVFKSAIRLENGLKISYNYAEKGLKTTGKQSVKGFAVCGKDGKWMWANAQISGNEILIMCDKQISRVQYAWQSNPEANLYNAIGLPAVPFSIEVK